MKSGPTHRFHSAFAGALITLTRTVHPVDGDVRVLKGLPKSGVKILSHDAYAGVRRMGDLFGQRTVLLRGALLLLVLPAVTHSFFNFVDIRVSINTYERRRSICEQSHIFAPYLTIVKANILRVHSGLGNQTSKNDN
jgi:hypothetical protein